ncbi:hypothetical protein ACI8AA_01730 [Geodermatophilus sp. SYSU D01180]
MDRARPQTEDVAEEAPVVEVDGWSVVLDEENGTLRAERTAG